MAALPRDTELVRTKSGSLQNAPTQDAASDKMSAQKAATASAVAMGQSMLRGRLASRMSEMAGKAAAMTGKKAAGTELSPPQAAPQSPRQDIPKEPAPLSAQGKPASSPGSTKTEQAQGGDAPNTRRVSRGLKQMIQPGQLKKEYRALQLRLHERVFDAPREELFFTPTKDTTPLSNLTINSPNRTHGHDYRPVPCQLFDWTLAQIDEDFSNFTFIDYGAGKGRALLLAARHPFSAAAGVEFAEELHDDAQMNIAQFPRSQMQCRNVECVLADAVSVGPPDGSSIHFFFNPFSRDVFAEVLNNIVLSYRTKPRRLYLILVDPVATDLIDACGAFTRSTIPKLVDLKWRALSPYDVAIYRSLA